VSTQEYERQWATCFAPGRSTQAKSQIVYGDPRPFMPRIWLLGTPEVGFEPDPIKLLPQRSSVQVRREMMQQLRGLA
jgi:hypothetical protein